MGPAVSRRQCREWALQFLYQAEFGGPDPEAGGAAQFWEHFHPIREIPPYFQELVTGVKAHLEELDALIRRFSEHWRLERMTLVDRNLLRLAAFELLYQPETPPKVVINEAVELAKKYSTEDSSAFVNGLLDRIRAELGRDL